MQRVLVTGATSGIGRAIADTLHRAGFAVTATGRNDTALADLRAACPGLDTLRLDGIAPAQLNAYALAARRAISKGAVALALMGVIHFFNRADNVGQRNITGVARQRIAAAWPARAGDQALASQTSKQQVEVRRRHTLARTDGR